MSRRMLMLIKLDTGNFARSSTSKQRRRKLIGSSKHSVNGTSIATLQLSLRRLVCLSIWGSVCVCLRISSIIAVVHTVTGSFLLLNTDLHIADISEHMSRPQYVRLTMDTITSHLAKEGTSRHASTPELVHNDSNSTLRTSIVSAPSPPVPAGNHRLGPAINLDRDVLNRKDSIASIDRTVDRSQRHSMLVVTNLGKQPSPHDARGRLPSSASVGSMAQHGSKWEAELESTLKVSIVMGTTVGDPVLIVSPASSSLTRIYINPSNPDRYSYRQLTTMRSAERAIR